MEPDVIETYDLGSFWETAAQYPDLPKVVYLFMLQSQGLLHDTWVYGVDAKRILPSIIHPNELFDGAIVSGNCVSACDKNTTYHHLNNPVAVSYTHLDVYKRQVGLPTVNWAARGKRNSPGAACLSAPPVMPPFSRTYRWQ